MRLLRHAADLEAHAAQLAEAHAAELGQNGESREMAPTGGLQLFLPQP
jgi:hypothetical protein